MRGTKLKSLAHNRKEGDCITTSDDLRRKLDYAFLLFGLTLLAFLFIPAPVIFLNKYLDFSQTAGSMLGNILYGTLPVYFLALFFALVHYAFIREFIDDFIEFGYNTTLALAAAICFLFIFFLLRSFASIELALFGYDALLGWSVTFLGMYYIISSVRDLNKLDKIEF